MGPEGAKRTRSAGAKLWLAYPSAGQGFTLCYSLACPFKLDKKVNKSYFIDDSDPLN